MPGFLQRLRTKPPKTRKRIALGASVTITSLVFVMWVTVLNYGFIGSGPEMQDINTNTTQVASPLSAFSENASTAFQQLKEGFASSTDIDSSTFSTSSQTVSNRGSSRQPTNDSDTYWENHQRTQVEVNSTDTESTKSKSQSAAVNNSANNSGSSEESFTSRNYNPNQESDWFNE